ncbi:MAG: biopolymer transporter ExbD [Microbacteriaceae bacterium]|jgi:biopolymer transport protein ExbD|nr:biopolymer transporter ExbD [Microbacteriaceae bacterium]
MLYANARSAESSAMSEINITPLIDVMLTVLVIFMIAAPLLTHRIPLPIGESRQPPSKIEPLALAISIRSGGGLVFQGQSSSRSELDLGLRAASAGGVPVQLDVIPDAHSSYEDLAQVLAMAHSHGIGNIRVVQVASAQSTGY